MHTTITIGGENYSIRYTINSVATMEERSGTKVMKIVEDVQGNSISALRWLLWGGLVEMQANLTPSHAGELLEDYYNDPGTTLIYLPKLLLDSLLDCGFFKKAAQLAADMETEETGTLSVVPAKTTKSQKS